MASLMNLTLISILYFCFISNVLTDSDTCVKKSPCKCEFSNGTGIDLTPSAVGSTFYTAQEYSVDRNVTKYEMSTYYYHPCNDVSPMLNTSIKANTCTTPLSLCRHLLTMKLDNVTTKTYKSEEEYDYLGTNKNIEFSNDGLSIIYKNGPSETIVMLVCAETSDTLHVYSLAEPNRVVLSFYTKQACLKQIEYVSHRSFGSTLLIIFFSFLIFYLVLGVVTKKFLMGATGLEVIPNLGFWMELPGLCKDGWAFIRNGCKVEPRERQASTHDPNSYDSI